MTTRNVKVDLRANVAQYVAAMKTAGAATKELHDDIDKTSDRTAWMAQGILALTPAVTTLGAAAVPVISGLATQMTVAAAAGGTMALAFNGVGDALGALNDYQLKPTEENLAKLEESMAKIGPEGEKFVRFLDSLGPAFSDLANTARSGMFPGFTEGITEFMELMPRFQSIVAEISSGIGELAASAGADLAGEEWEAFFTFLETDAKPTLIAMGNTLGNFAQGLGSMMVAFGPLSADFSSGFEDMSKTFADWSAGLTDSDGFQEFVDYVQKAAPLALDFLGSLSMAFVELAEAAAVIGPLALQGLTKLLDIIGDLLDTPLGPLVIGFTALTSTWGRLNAVMAITGSGVMGKAAGGFIGNLKTIGTTAGTTGAGLSVLTRNAMTAGSATEKMAAQNAKAVGSLTAFGRAAGPVAGQIGLMALAVSDVDDKFGLTNTTALTLAGSFLGPWGTAVGAGAGLLLDMKSGADEASTGFRGLSDAIDDGRLDELKAQIQEAKAEFADQEEVTGFRDAISDALRDIKLSGSGSVTGEMVAELERAEAALARFKAAEDRGSDNRRFNNSILRAAEAMREGTSAADEFANELEELEAALSGRADMRNYEAAIDGFTKSLKKNGRTFDINTEKGRNNQAALDDIAGSMIAVADTMQGTARKKFLTQGIADLEAMGSKFKIPKSQMRELIGLLEDANRRDVKPKITADGTSASATMRAIRAEMIDLNGTTATTYVNTVRTVTGPQGAAAFSQKAFGDVKDRHAPEIAAGGAWRVWAEPETQGESYIPHANDSRRPRARNILEETATILGGSVEWYARGGSNETDAAKKAREAVEKAKQRKKEREEREEVRRLRELDAQRAKDLLASDLRNEREQARLEKRDAVRRLESAKEAGRPKSEIRDAQLAVKQERVDLADMRLGVKIERLTAVSELQTEALKSATEKTEEWSAKMDDVAQSTTSGFRTGLFDRDSNVWGAGAGGGALSNLSRDIAGLGVRSGLQSQLAGAGLSGDALAALLGEGNNADISGLISSGQVGQYAALYNQRAALQGSVGAAGGQAAYGANYAEALRVQEVAAAAAQQTVAQIAALTATNARMEVAITRLANTSPERTGAEVGRVINGAAAQGQRDRVSGGRR